MLAARAAGLADDVSGWNPIERVVEPDAGRAAVYERRYATYRELYRATADLVHELSDDTR
jgi:xylulokinase